MTFLLDHFDDYILTTNNCIINLFNFEPEPMFKIKRNCN